ncbi:TonB-dependent receptor domain-containing protein [Novosphingobium kaempferiae]|uniref:TonB-dependent receptor domain-containing protein n=1 Tax=Novosphingobium kaempferiae TaxID=2896849 RepID=UPI001E5CF5FA|nr:TonB-dependent receptor [Novosphingobium kaempferiae]
MRAILSGGMALSALTGAATDAFAMEDARGRETFVTADAAGATGRSEAGRRRLDSLDDGETGGERVRLSLGMVWDLADEPGSAMASDFEDGGWGVVRVAAKGRTKGRSRTTAFYRRERAPGAGYRIVSGILGGSSQVGGVRFSYRGSYSLERTGADLRGLGCLSLASRQDVTALFDAASPCGSAPVRAERKARFHLRSLDRTWQGMGEASWSLGGGNALAMGGGYRKTRQLFDEGLGAPARRGPAPMPTGAPFSITSVAGAFTGAPTPTDTGFATGTGILSGFRQKEKIATLFASSRIALGGVTLVPGLRYERTRLRVGGFLSDDGTSGTPMVLRRTYGSMLPSIVAGMSPARSIALRARWSRDMGRPDLAMLSPGAIVEGRRPQVWVGNPDLVPYRTDSFDLTAVWAPDGDGCAGCEALSVNLFARLVDDPIVAANETRIDTAFAARRYDRLNVTRAINARRGEVAGIEAQYARRLNFLPVPLSDLSLRLSAGYAQSRLLLADGRSTRFPFQPRTLYSAALSWQRGPVESVVTWTGTSAALLALNDGPDGPVRQAPLRRLDVRTRVTLSPDLNLFVEGRNLTDEQTRQFQDGMRNWTIEGERYGRSISAGIWARF